MNKKEYVLKPGKIYSVQQTLIGCSLYSSKQLIGIVLNKEACYNSATSYLGSFIAGEKFLVLAVTSSDHVKLFRFQNNTVFWSELNILKEYNHSFSEKTILYWVEEAFSD